MTIEVELADLALVLFLPEPSVDYGEPVPNPRVHGNPARYPHAKCARCGQPAGAHYCHPRMEAYDRLRRQTRMALFALPDGVAP